MASIKISSDVLSNVLDHSCELRSILMVEKFWHRHGPVEPGVEDFGVLRVVGRDQVVHRGDVASCLNCDLVSGFDSDGRKRVRFRADLVVSSGQTFFSDGSQNVFNLETLTILNLLYFISNLALFSFKSMILYGPSHLGVNFGFLPRAVV